MPPGGGECEQHRLAQPLGSPWVITGRHASSALDKPEAYILSCLYQEAKAWVDLRGAGAGKESSHPRFLKKEQKATSC